MRALPRGVTHPPRDPGVLDAFRQRSREGLVWRGLGLRPPARRRGEPLEVWLAVVEEWTRWVMAPVPRVREGESAEFYRERVRVWRLKCCGVPEGER